MPAPQPSHPEGLLRKIKATSRSLLARYPRARFLVFWDLDGTLLHGDCSEGLSIRGRVVYPGLVQLGIERGFSSAYRGRGAFERAMTDYAFLKERVGPWIAYPFLAQIFAGASAKELGALSRGHFEGVLSGHFYPGAKRLFDGLSALGVEQHVLSASPEIFVRGAASCLGVPAGRLHGIRLRAPRGKLARELAYPVTYAEGKVAKLSLIVKASTTESRGRPVFVLGAFGDSPDNDGPLLAHVSGLALPSGTTVAALVNAEPTDSKDARLQSIRFTPAPLSG